ncbi:MAG: YopX family protein [Oscillospiraceae bacterium]
MEMNNREILFRGKRLDNGQWTYGGICQTEQWTCIIVAKDFEGSLYESPYCDVEDFDVVPETVGQYTGLIDRNGKRIFEGDIIKGKEKATYAVGYSDATAGFYAKATSPQKMLPCMTIGTMKYYAVIGNIHDNPELLSTASLPEAEDISQPVLQPATPENFELMQG